MSLLDALLLDPHPLDIYIAWRTDGVFGSGTLNDPYNGSTAARFDQIMLTKLFPNTQVHIGPGTFMTGGYREGAAA